MADPTPENVKIVIECAKQFDSQFTVQQLVAGVAKKNAGLLDTFPDVWAHFIQQSLVEFVPGGEQRCYRLTQGAVSDQS